jgi:hypothetical protein
MLIQLDEEKQEAKARKEERRMNRSDEYSTMEDHNHQVTSDTKSPVSSEDERATGSELQAYEQNPHLDTVSTEEPAISPVSTASSGDETVAGETYQANKLPAMGEVPREPVSEAFGNEANFAQQDTLKKSSLEEQPESVDCKQNQADAASEVDSTLLDPALRESAATEEPAPNKDLEERHPAAGYSSAELIAERAFSAPLANDFKVGDSTLSYETQYPPNSSKPEQDLKDVMAKSSHPSKATVSARDPQQSPESDVSRESENAITAPKSPKGEFRVTSWLKSKLGFQTDKPREQSGDSRSQDAMGRTPHSVSASEETEGHEENQRAHEISSHKNEVPTALSTEAGQGDPGATSPNPQNLVKASRSISPTSTGEGGTLRQPTSGSDDHFEDSQDHFASEKIASSTTPVNPGRTFDRQKRDSKFQEDL